MTIQRMIELLEIEHKCILRNSNNNCDRKCADCDLVQDDKELHEMYMGVIATLKEQPEIVRCKDCKHRSTYPEAYGAEINGKWCYWCELHKAWKHDDWFCADGKCKESK